MGSRFAQALRLVTASAGVGWIGAGCAVFAPNFSFHSYEELLYRTGEAVRLEVDPDLFELTRVEIEADHLLLYYRGVRDTLDKGWILRFSQKSSEQEPSALLDVYSLLFILDEKRPGLSLDGDGKSTVDSSEITYVQYSFDSSLRDDRGQALRGHGVIASLGVSDGSDILVYHLKLENQGTREITHDDLEPFLTAILE